MRVVVVMGTRPEAVKLAPVVSALRSGGAECTVLCTGQHRALINDILAGFDLAADVDLRSMTVDQDLSTLTSRLFAGIGPWLASASPDWVVVQGDTTSAMVAAMTAFYLRIPVAHVEAGLRTRDMTRPFPEELNRRVTTLVATRHFAPTACAARHLEREGVDRARIRVTGNTGIDTLLATLAAVRLEPPRHAPPIATFLDRFPRFVLVTGHRRESFGEGLEAVCRALDEAAAQHGSTGFLYALHPNPRAREPALRLLGGRRNLLLAEPFGHRDFVDLLDRCHLVVTDSGGVQEEASSLGKPALVLREVTERPEAVIAGGAKLVGTSAQRLVAALSDLILDPRVYDGMAARRFLYGDGAAGYRIARELVARSDQPADPGGS